MKATEKLMRLNGLKSLKDEKNETERIEKLEKIIQEQDEALMELAELIVGGVTTDG